MKFKCTASATSAPPASGVQNDAVEPCTTDRSCGVGEGISIKCWKEIGISYASHQTSNHKTERCQSTHPSNHHISVPKC